MTLRQTRDLVIDARAAELLTVKEFARLIRRDQQTIYRRIWRGAQPGVIGDGRHYLIDVAVALVSPPPDA